MNIEHLLYDYLVSIGQSEASAKYLNLFALLAALLIITLLIIL